MKKKKKPNNNKYTIPFIKYFDIIKQRQKNRDSRFTSNKKRNFHRSDTVTIDVIGHESDKRSKPPII